MSGLKHRKGDISLTLYGASCHQIYTLMMILAERYQYVYGLAGMERIPRRQYIWGINVKCLTNRGPFRERPRQSIYIWGINVTFEMLKPIRCQS